MLTTSPDSGTTTEQSVNSGMVVGFLHLTEELGEKKICQA